MTTAHLLLRILEVWALVSVFVVAGLWLLVSCLIRREARRLNSFDPWRRR